MSILTGFLRYALLAIGWDVVRESLDLVATDLHGTRYRITVRQCDDGK
jgi:hypothetical protein